MQTIDQQLIKACKKGDTLTVKQLLQQGANPNAKGNRWPNPTALLIATENGHIPIIALLIEHGADPHATDRNGQSALHYALEKQYDDIAKYLITQLKLNPNTKDIYGYTLFLIATINGDIHTLKFLIQHGANPNTTDHEGKTALHYAVEKRYRDITQYLLTELQLNPNIQDQRGRTPFLLAAQNGDIDMLQLLIQLGANPYATDRYDQTALHYAVENQQHDIAHYLITELKLDTNRKDGYGRTPLMLASANGDIKTIQLLIQLGANPYATDKRGRTALHYAVENQCHDIAQYLLTQLQLNPNIQDENGITPFLLATKRKDIKILQLLAQHGADPNIPTHDDQTALHHALEKQYHDIAQYLITQLHINPNTQNNNGITPFLLATKNGDIHTLKRLIQHGANPYLTDKRGRTALHYAVEKGDYKTTQYLIIQLNFDPNTQDHKGITPFMIAAENGDIPMLRLLIQHDANPHATDHQGRSALHYAVKPQKPKVVSFLMTDIHFDPNSQDHEGVTPFLLALQHHRYQTAYTLTQLGAHPHIPNHQGQTPTSIARRLRIPLKKPQTSTITL